METQLTIPHSRPWVGSLEADACRRVILSGYLSQGREVHCLEQELSTLVGHQFGVAVSSGTAALFLALRALGIDKSDHVIAPSYACTALLNAIYAAGAKPVLCDIEPSTASLTRDTVKNALTTRTKAIIIPHLFGYPAPTKEIMRLGIPIIEDCAQCVGATRDGAVVGGDSIISVFSFYATKLISAGEGGLIATSNKQIARSLRDLREYDNPRTYLPRFNYKMSDLTAAVARAQLQRLPTIIQKRRRIAHRYQQALTHQNTAPQPLVVENGVLPVYFRYIIRYKKPIKHLLQKARSAGIGISKPVFKPLHQYLGTTSLPGTAELFAQALSLPIYPGLSLLEQRKIISLLPD